MSDRRGRNLSTEDLAVLHQELTSLRQEIADLPSAVGAELAEAMKPVERMGTTIAYPTLVAQALKEKLDSVSDQLQQLSRKLEGEIMIPEPTLLGMTQREWNSVMAGVPVGVVLTMALIDVTLNWVR